MGHREERASHPGARTRLYQAHRVQVAFESSLAGLEPSQSSIRPVMLSGLQ